MISTSSASWSYILDASGSLLGETVYPASFDTKDLPNWFNFIKMSLKRCCLARWYKPTDLKQWPKEAKRLYLDGAREYDELGSLNYSQRSYY